MMEVKSRNFGSEIRDLDIRMDIMRKLAVRYPPFHLQHNEKCKRVRMLGRI
jgi:hypothetical protein